MIYLIVDALIVISMIILAYFCFKLHVKLQSVSSINSNLMTVLKNLNATITHATPTLDHFRQSASDIQQSLAPLVRQAHRLRDDMAHLVEHGDRLADRLMATYEAVKPTQPTKNSTIQSTQVAAPPLTVQEEDKLAPNPKLNVFDKIMRHF